MWTLEFPERRKSGRISIGFSPTLTGAGLTLSSFGSLTALPVQCRTSSRTRTFQALGIEFVSLTEGVDTSTPAGKTVFTVLGAVAELEWSLIVERVKAGLRNARPKGKRLGRPHKILDTKKIAALRAQGFGWKRIAADLGVGVGTICADRRERRCRVGHRAMVSAKGRSPGFTAELDDFPDDDVTIVVLSNSYSSVIQDPIAAGIAAIVFGNDPPKPQTVSSAPMSQSALASYAGEYQYGPDYFDPNAKFSLRPQSGFLVLQLGETHSTLLSLGHDEFTERMYFGSIKIMRDAQGKIEGLITRYGNRTFSARRLEPR